MVQGVSRKDISDKMVIQACADGVRDKRACGDVLAEKTGACNKVILRAIERAIIRGYVDCGVSEWWSFPTEKGEQMLAE